jgi:hypothetical protein
LKKINEIGLCSPKEIINFIELKNLDLVFWTYEDFYFYNLSEKKYIKYQEINESNQETENDDSEFNYFRYERRIRERENYKINSICQLKNGNLVSCNSYGIKTYSKEKDKYILKSKHKIYKGFKNAFEIELNKLVLFREAHYFGGHCSETYYNYYICSLSIYDNEKDTITELNEFRENVPFEISYFKNDKFLFVKNGNFKFDIYDINQILKSINQNNEIIGNKETEENEMEENDEEGDFYFGEKEKKRKIKDEMNIRFLSKYSEDLFFQKI